MYKVLIADDEPLVRIGLNSSLPWEQLDLVLVGEASNGQEALMLIETHMPDILLLDIGMPVIDGIQLMEIIKQRGYFIQVLVLSCHNEFEYVKQAMKLGAFDYILKLSLDIDELVRQLTLMKQKIGDTGNAGFDQDKKLICDVIYKQLNYLPIVTPLAVQEFYRRMQLCESQLLIIELQQRPMEQADIYFNMLRETALRTLPPEQEWYYCVLDSCKLLILLSGQREEQVEELVRRMLDTLRTYLSSVFYIGVSAPFSGVTKLHEAVRQADTALRHSFYTTGQDAFFYTKEQPYQMHSLISITLEKEIYEQIERGNFAAVKQIVGEIIAEHEQKKMLHPSVLLGNMIEITGLFAKYLRVFNLSLVDIDQQYQRFFEQILRYHNIFELKTNYLTFLDRYAQTISDICKIGSREDILKAKEYMKDHFRRPLCLEDVAGYVNMSKNYFSYLFKKETGYSYVSYLNTLRIKEAQWLFQTGSYRVYEVAEMVGYNNTNYFHKIFKKVTGANPNDYKR